jgi:hypothetical protein
MPVVFLSVLINIQDTRLLSSLLGLLFLLTFQPVHVGLEQIAVGELKLVHLLGVDHCRNFLIFEDSPEKK